MFKRQVNACAISQYRAGDEVLFKYEGLLVGTVKCVRFSGGKVRYELTLSLECEVPESEVLSGGVQQICGGVQSLHDALPQSGGLPQIDGGAAEI
jgi:hypothetical protein